MASDSNGAKAQLIDSSIDATKDDDERPNSTSSYESAAAEMPGEEQGEPIPQQSTRPQLPGPRAARGKSDVQDFGGNEDAEMPAPKRVRTEPQQRVRPGIGPRQSTLGGMKRSRTGLQLGLGRANTFQYQFKEEPLSDSDDSSSSSESEDEEPEKPTTADTPQQQPLDGSDNAAEENKKRAKKRYAYSRFTIGNDLFKTKGRISRKDGRLKISINETANSGYVAKALGQSIRNHLDIPTRSKSKKARGEDQKKKDVDADAESLSS
jgi:hypothetical protein